MTQEQQLSRLAVANHGIESVAAEYPDGSAELDLLMSALGNVHNAFTLISKKTAVANRDGVEVAPDTDA